jgi:hypothetical protein
MAELDRGITFDSSSFCDQGRRLGQPYAKRPPPHPQNLPEAWLQPDQAARSSSQIILDIIKLKSLRMFQALITIKAR